MRYPLIYGTIAGAIIVGMSSIIFAVSDGLHSTSPLLGYLVMLVALSMLFVGIKRYRDVECGGVIRFGRALMLGLGMAVVTAIIYVVAWEISFATVGSDFMEQYVEVAAREMQADGKSPAEIAQARSDMQAFAETYRSNLLLRIGFTLIEILPVGVLVALVSAAILRNPRVLPARQAG